MDCAGRPDFAKGVHTDDEMRRRIAPGDRFCAWVAFACLILSADCARTADFVHRASTDDKFRARITQGRRILCIACTRKLVFVEWITQADLIARTDCTRMVSSVGMLFAV